MSSSIPMTQNPSAASKSGHAAVSVNDEESFDSKEEGEDEDDLDELDLKVRSPEAPAAAPHLPAALLKGRPSESYTSSSFDPPNAGTPPALVRPPFPLVRDFLCAHAGSRACVPLCRGLDPGPRLPR